MALGMTSIYYHLPLERLDVMQLLPTVDGNDEYWSKPSFCIRPNTLKLKFVGVNSGSGISPLRYCMT
jgi:hypothetical protein